MGQNEIITFYELSNKDLKERKKKKSEVVSPKQRKAIVLSRVGLGLLPLSGAVGVMLSMSLSDVLALFLLPFLLREIAFGRGIRSHKIDNALCLIFLLVLIFDIARGAFGLVIMIPVLVLMGRTLMKYTKKIAKALLIVTISLSVITLIGAAAGVANPATFVRCMPYLLFVLSLKMYRESGENSEGEPIA